MIQDNLDQNTVNIKTGFKTATMGLNRKIDQQEKVLDTECLYLCVVTMQAGEQKAYNNFGEI